MAISRRLSPRSSYLDILVKLIPGEIIAAFMGIQGLFSKADDKVAKYVLWISFSILLCSLPFYLYMFYKVINGKHIACTMISFGVWAYCMGGPFQTAKIYDGRIGGAALIVWTLILLPMIMKYRRSEICRGDWVKITDKKGEDIEREDGLIQWNLGMSEFFSKEAQVVRVNRKYKTARLDVDKKKNGWAFEWLTIQNEK